MCVPKKRDIGVIRRGFSIKTAKRTLHAQGVSVSDKDSVAANIYHFRFGDLLSERSERNSKITISAHRVNDHVIILTARKKIGQTVPQKY